MAFHEIQFPSDISYGSSGGPRYSTDVVTLHSGYEQRNQNWGDARAVYNASHGVKTKTQLDELMAFFRARKGRAHGFRFKDWGDYQAIGQQLGAGDDVTTQYQLVKAYESGSETETRIITKPVLGSIKIYVNTIEQTSGVSIDTTTGMVTFDTAPSVGASITADFEFDVPVRFDADQIAYVFEEFGVFNVSDIPLVEIRV